MNEIQGDWSTYRFWYTPSGDYGGLLSAGDGGNIVYPSCPAGQTLSGSSCLGTITTTTTTTTAATISSYTCPSGSALSGSTCVTSTSTTATISYSCPSGQTLSGSNCTQTVTTTSPATPNYTCPAGQTLSGSSCIDSNNVSTPATMASYTCPAGATLSGSSCITVVSTPANISYSCADGSAPIAGVCFFRSAQTNWTNTCGSLESSAGASLGTPK